MIPLNHNIRLARTPVITIALILANVVAGSRRTSSDPSCGSAVFLASTLTDRMSTHLRGHRMRPA